jgi:hypothetical protein
MKIDMNRSVSISFLIAVLGVAGCKQKDVSLTNDRLQLHWKQAADGWHATGVQVRVGGAWQEVGKPEGSYTLLYSEQKPDSTPTAFKTNTGVPFPEPVYRYQQGFWKDATSPVSLNTAGEAVTGYPSDVNADGKRLVFTVDNAWASITASWALDERFPNDVVVEHQCVVKKPGYYSFATPTLATVPEADMAWATVPGYFQGDSIQPDFIRAYAYGQGVPALPVIYRERCASTLAAIVDTKQSVSLAVIPRPGLGRDPWAHDHITHEDWHIGLSHRNRAGALSPSLYYPVLGQKPSRLQAGDTVKFAFRYSLRHGTWCDQVKHTANDIYQFKETLALRQNKQSLTHRIEAMCRYLTDTKTSMWHVESFEGRQIGGQSYLGGVVGSQGDAIKNSDYGAMWMLARATGDPALQKNVLPYALNFKLAQQQTTPGFFQGAAMGQYYLAKRKVFVEEWGEFVEPVSLTYYTMLDDGNILLFEPNHKVLLERLRLGAELLLKWQQPDGSWKVAYDQNTKEPLFQDIDDLRPTFYGLMVAHRILKDPKYLAAAEKGAAWFIRQGVEKGHFIGVCGDARYAPDFATAQSAQALLDLYDITGKKEYLEAALKTARIYTTSIYTHPIPSRTPKTVYGTPREDWEISQAGLSFEHGGIMGSAQRQGPIQLASHAGLFVRAFQLTQDSLFIDMARAAAIGRDAFVDSATSVASYYWYAMNKGAGPYPHHAWWQIGWITDYLLAEAQLRSAGDITFPRGFVTPKVGPHQSYGFAPGTVYGDLADLVIRPGLIVCDNPSVEYITAYSASKNRLFVILLNDQSIAVHAPVAIYVDKWKPGVRVKALTAVPGGQSVASGPTVDVSLSPYGLAVYALDLQ